MKTDQSFCPLSIYTAEAPLEEDLEVAIVDLQNGIGVVERQASEGGQKGQGVHPVLRKPRDVPAKHFRHVLGRRTCHQRWAHQKCFQGSIGDH